MNKETALSILDKEIATVRYIIREAWNDGESDEYIARHTLRLSSYVSLRESVEADAIAPDDAMARLREMMFQRQEYVMPWDK